MTILYIPNSGGPKCSSIQKKIVRAFKFWGFKIEISFNIKVANFLDVILNLSDNFYRPFLKTDQYPFYINVNSNHPNSIIKQVPKAVNTRISRLSSNKKISVKLVKCILLKLFTESLTRCPVTGWKIANHRLPFFRFPPDPYEGVSYERPSSFACVIPQNQDMPACSLSLLDANTRLWGFFQQLKHKKQGSIFFNPTKRTQEIQTVKRTPFTSKFPANQLFARTIFSFLSFYVNISFFYNILNRVAFLSFCRSRNIVTM